MAERFSFKIFVFSFSLKMYLNKCQVPLLGVNLLQSAMNNHKQIWMLNFSWTEDKAVFMAGYTGNFTHKHWVFLRQSSFPFPKKFHLSHVPISANNQLKKRKKFKSAWLCLDLYNMAAHGSCMHPCRRKFLIDLL